VFHAKDKRCVVSSFRCLSNHQTSQPWRPLRRHQHVVAVRVGDSDKGSGGQFRHRCAPRLAHLSCCGSLQGLRTRGRSSPLHSANDSTPCPPILSKPHTEQQQQHNWGRSNILCFALDGPRSRRPSHNLLVVCELGRNRVTPRASSVLVRRKSSCTSYWSAVGAVLQFQGIDESEACTRTRIYIYLCSSRRKESQATTLN
jgi:hypothetical protein